MLQESESGKGRERSSGRKRGRGGEREREERSRGRERDCLRGELKLKVRKCPRQLKAPDGGEGDR